MEKLRWLISDLLSFLLHLMVYIFPYILFVLHPYIFQVVFSFSFNSKYFKNFPWDFFLTHVLFRSVFFNTKYLWDFPALSLFLIFSIVTLWYDNILCIIPFLLDFFQLCFMAQNVVYLCEFCMWAWEGCVCMQLLLDGVFLLVVLPLFASCILILYC